ncbi:hypothetical protein [Streptomyces sp. NPDC002324]
MVRILQARAAAQPGIHLLGIEELPGTPPHVLLGFHRRRDRVRDLLVPFLPTGPLEWVLGKVTKPAGLVR